MLGAKKKPHLSHVRACSLYHMTMVRLSPSSSVTIVGVIPRLTRRAEEEYARLRAQTWMAAQAQRTTHNIQKGYRDGVTALQTLQAELEN